MTRPTGRRPSIVKDLIAIVDFMLENQCTTRDAAKNFGITHSAINYNIKNKLPDMDQDKYVAVMKLLEKNKIEGPKHLKGGNKGKETTRERKPKVYRDDKCAPPEPLYFCMEDLDLTFYHFQVKDVIEMWEESWTLEDIAHKMKRDPDEIAVLLMDLGRKNKISLRTKGYAGGKLVEVE